jgi:heat shock protein HslJ
MRPIYLLLISLSLVTASCGSGQPGATELAIPSKWSLVSFGKTGAETPVVEGSAITLELNEDNQLGGSGGCNSYGAQYSLEGQTLTVKEVVSTLMACADDLVMQQETQYFTALQNISSFEISGDTLTIYYDNGQSQLNFVKQ